MTGTSIKSGSPPLSSLTNVFARITSRCVTPSTFLLSNTPCFFSTSHATGTVLFTGFEMMFSQAAGQCAAIASTKSRTIPAFTANKSSLLIPGLRGMPAGMTTKSHPASAAPSCEGPVNPRTVAREFTWLTSAATPATLAMSYKRKSRTSGCCLRSRERGWPIPPAAPNTATVNPPFGPICRFTGVPTAGSMWFAIWRTRWWNMFLG
mmetsp:Transcript_14876/g.49089  ORF Transcript_14876/g.49089 Transcript_14876/m.49089 type:complete len:207 (+) Transcript_14876:1489-2109(+)